VSFGVGSPLILKVGYLIGSGLQVGQYHGAGALMGLGLRFRQPAQRYRLPLVAVLGFFDSFLTFCPIFLSFTLNTV
jgi:hypothetical protein